MTYSIDSQTLRKAAADFEAISDAGCEQRFRHELNRRLRCDSEVYSQLHGNSLPFGSEFWADSFAKELAGLLDAPVHQVKGAVLDLLPLTKRKVALQLLGEMANEARMRQAAATRTRTRRTA